jgi:hypothetical protein
MRAQCRGLKWILKNTKTSSFKERTGKQQGPPKAADLSIAETVTVMRFIRDRSVELAALLKATKGSRKKPMLGNPFTNKKENV